MRRSLNFEWNQRCLSPPCRKSRCAGTAARWIWPLPPRDFKLPSFVLEFTFEIKANLWGEPAKAKLQYRQVLFLFSKAE